MSKIAFIKHQQQTINGKDYEYYYIYESYYNPGMKNPTNFKVGKVGDDVDTLVSNLKSKADDKDIDLQKEDIDHFKIQVNTVEAKAKEKGLDEDEKGEFYEKAFSGDLEEDSDADDSYPEEIGDWVLEIDSRERLVYSAKDQDKLFATFHKSGDWITVDFGKMDMQRTGYPKSDSTTTVDRDKDFDYFESWLEDLSAAEAVGEYSKYVDLDEDSEDDWSDLLSQNVSEVKEDLEDISKKHYQDILEAEKNGKDRKTVKSYLEKEIREIPEASQDEIKEWIMEYISFVVDHPEDPKDKVDKEEVIDMVYTDNKEPYVYLEKEEVEEGLESLIDEGMYIEDGNFIMPARADHSRVIKFIDNNQPVDPTEIVDRFSNRAKVNRILSSLEDDGVIRLNGDGLYVMNNAEWKVDRDDPEFKKLTLVDEGEAHTEISVKMVDEDGRPVKWNYVKRNMENGTITTDKDAYSTEEMQEKISTMTSIDVGSLDWSKKLDLERPEGDWYADKYSENKILLVKSEDEFTQVNIKKQSRNYFVSYNVKDESSVSIANGSNVGSRAEALERAEDIIDDIENDEVDDADHQEEEDDSGSSVKNEEPGDKKKREMLKDMGDNQYFENFVDEFGLGDWDKLVENGWSDLDEDDKEWYVEKLDDMPTTGVPHPHVSVADPAMIVMFTYRPSGITKDDSNLDFNFEAKYFMPKSEKASYTADVDDPEKVLDADGGSLYSNEYLNKVRSVFDNGFRAWSGTDFPAFFSPKGSDKTAIVLAPRIEEE